MIPTILILSSSYALFFTTFPFGSVLKFLFDDFFHIDFGYTIIFIYLFKNLFTVDY